MELERLSLRDALKAMREGVLSPAEYEGGLRARAARLDPHIQAFCWLTDESAQRDLPGLGDGPLGGAPVAVKDLIDTAGIPTSYGSRAFAGHVPQRDAAVVARLKSIGASVFGKTVTTELAWSDPGPTRNPWNLGHTPGGSSSGSAAAVAAGMVPLALGTQTFGSIVRPASFCGVVGFKPSFGAIPRAGARELSQSLDHIGVFARDVGDAALAIAHLAIADGTDPERAPPDVPTALDPHGGRPRIGLVRTPDWDLADRDQRELVEKAASDFAAAGAIVDEVVLPDEFSEAAASARILLVSEAADVFGALVAERGRDLRPGILGLVAEGAATAATRYIAEKRRQKTLTAQIDAIIGERDALLTLPVIGAAPAGLDSTGDPRFCVLWSYLGLPALALPAGRSANGLPLGVQLVGRLGDDATLLRAGLWCEQVIGRPTQLAEPTVAADPPGAGREASVAG